MAAARTPTVTQANMGSSKLIMAKITTCVVNDTWVSGLTGVVNYWAQVQASGGTQASAGINVSLSGSTFTFQPGLDSQTVVLYVMVNG